MVKEGGKVNACTEGTQGWRKEEGRGRKVGEEGRKDLGRGAEDAAY